VPLPGFVMIFSTPMLERNVLCSYAALKYKLVVQDETSSVCVKRSSVNQGWIQVQRELKVCKNEKVREEADGWRF
jgi:hypothetical protein